MTSVCLTKHLPGIRMAESTTTRRVGHVAHGEEKGNVYTVLAGKSGKKKRPLGR